VQLVVIQKIMNLWIPDEKYQPLWVSVIYILVVLFNLLNVRRYGEIEYWLTVIKLMGTLIIIILGILLPMRISAGTRQLGTTSNNLIVSCSDTLLQEGRCLDAPGFSCMYTVWVLIELIHRLGRRSISYLFL
jgi:amino acid permease